MWKRYDIQQTWQWNLTHGPDESDFAQLPSTSIKPLPGVNCLFGHHLNSCLGIPAGPLLNSSWLLYYARLGYDILTYKTVRTAARSCYDLPNLVPVSDQPLAGPGGRVSAVAKMHGSWAVSFGMPSVPPEHWRADVRRAKDGLGPGQLLIVSVVGEDRMANCNFAGQSSADSLQNLADDYALCAEWAVAAGADVIEANFSCPNVCSVDGQLYQHEQSAVIVAQAIRERIADTPLVLKTGFLESRPSVEALVRAVGPYVDGLCLTNAVSAVTESPSGQLLFDGGSRGICGRAIRDVSLQQVEWVRRTVDEWCPHLTLIGVGGICDRQDVRAFLSAGADAVQLATSAMVDPATAMRIRADW